MIATCLSSCLALRATVEAAGPVPITMRSKCDLLFRLIESSVPYQKHGNRDGDLQQTQELFCIATTGVRPTSTLNATRPSRFRPSGLCNNILNFGAVFRFQAVTVCYWHDV